jgi:glycosyltransferase involved in cell wall biosynthesis
MRVAVLTLTRDRDEYSRHCFETLQQNAGVEFDHYVLDNGSQDDTLDWLYYEWRPATPHHRVVVEAGRNLGIHKGWNMLLELADDTEPYDVYVTMDNDCEMTEHGTLKAVCDAVHPYSGWIASPWVNGLQNPLTPAGEYLANGLRIGQTPHIGGICRAMPGEFVRNGFRFDEAQPIWGGDEGHITRAFLPGHVGWLLDWTVNHYRTTDGQQAEQGPYFDRKFREMGLR